MVYGKHEIVLLVIFTARKILSYCSLIISHHHQFSLQRSEIARYVSSAPYCFRIRELCRVLWA